MTHTEGTRCPECKEENIRIKYNELDSTLGGAIQARYKGVWATIAEGDDWVSIYTIWSLNKRQGEVNEFIKLLKEDHPDKTMYSSVPLNPIWEYICKKHNINFSYEESPPL
jgi:hypothetical protein